MILRDEIYTILETINQDADFRDSYDFVDEGFLDSLQVLELIDVLCDKYNIEIRPEEIDPDNFVSVEKIEALIKRHAGKLE